MGYAKIVLGVEADRRDKYKRKSSEQVLAALEKQLKQDKLYFVEDYETVVTEALPHDDRCQTYGDCHNDEHRESRKEMVIVRWGSDLNAEEKEEL